MPCQKTLPMRNNYGKDIYSILVLDLGCCDRVIGVARIFDWGGPKSQITCNDVIRNFETGIFLWGQRYRRMEDQKSWPGVGT